MIWVGQYNCTEGLLEGEVGLGSFMCVLLRGNLMGGEGGGWWEGGVGDGGQKVGHLDEGKPKGWKAEVMGKLTDIDQP